MATSRPKVLPVISSQQQRLIDQLSSMFTGNMNAGGIGVQPTDFGQFGDLGRASMLSLAGLEQAGLGGQVQGTRGEEELSQIINRGPTNLDDFIESNIVNPTIQDFNQRLLPGLRNTASGQGVRFSQGQANRERGAASDATERIAKARAGAQLTGRQMDADTLMNAIASRAGLRSSGIADLLSILQGGDTQRQAGLQVAGMTEDARARAIAQALGIGGTQTHSIGPGPTQSGQAIDWVSAILGGGGGSAAGMGIAALAACHGAAAHFGWFTPKWYAARLWIMYGWPTTSPNGVLFRKFYLRYSPMIGYMIEHSKEMRASSIGFFEWCASMGGKARVF